MQNVLDTSSLTGKVRADHFARLCPQIVTSWADCLQVSGTLFKPDAAGNGLLQAPHARGALLRSIQAAEQEELGTIRRLQVQLSLE